MKRTPLPPQVWVNKESGILAEVLENTFFGRVFFLKDTTKKTGEKLSDICDDGLMYFEDMIEANPEDWENLGWL